MKGWNSEVQYGHRFLGFQGRRIQFWSFFDSKLIIINWRLDWSTRKHNVFLPGQRFCRLKCILWNQVCWMRSSFNFEKRLLIIKILPWDSWVTLFLLVLMHFGSEHPVHIEDTTSYLAGWAYAIFRHRRASTIAAITKFCDVANLSNVSHWFVLKMTNSRFHSERYLVNRNYRLRSETSALDCRLPSSVESFSFSISYRYVRAWRMNSAR